ncbi:MAG: T9SS type A sorting domain-containing protein [Bacteroidia bacterium]|nr:T9SS type A sorting domain-containing protein [Bacteroidia bacterium]
MKKSRMQVLIEFSSLLSQIRKTGKANRKKTNTNRKGGKLSLLLILFISIQSISFAATYYSRTNGGDWTNNTSWSTVSYGNATNTGTYPRAGDIANIGDGYTIYIDNNNACATLNIGQGASAILEYRSTANFTLTVSGNVTVNTGARFWYNTATNRSHSCIVGGNFTNYGIVDFFRSSSQHVNLTMNAASNSTVSGIGTWDLNQVALNKSSIATQMTVQTNGFETGIKNFVGTMGTYIHNNTGTYAINPAAGNFIIGSNMAYRVPLGTMWFSAISNETILQGALYVNGGTVRIGTGAGLQGLRSDQNGLTIPYLEVSSGNLLVSGGITHGTSSASEPFRFNMSGGTITLNSGATGTNRQVFYVNDRPGSTFTMSGGTIILEKPNTNGPLTFDFSVCGSMGTVTTTGGTIQFGNNNTLAGRTFNFRPYAGVLQPNFRVTGNSTRTITLRTSYGSTASFRLRSLYIDVNKIFDIRSIGGTFGDNKTMTLTNTANGVDALFSNGSFVARTSTVTFNPTGAQAIGGSNVTTFYNLAINNANNITLNRAANVSNYLSMVNGRLITTNTNVLTCYSTANANLGSATAYVDGPMIHTVATSASIIKTYPIGKAGAYRPAVLTLRHVNSTSVTYRGEVFNVAASGLPFGLPPPIANVSNVRYLRFTRQLISNFSTGQIQMYYDSDDGVADRNSLIVAHDDAASMWQNHGGVATANWTGSITSAVFNTFNTFFALANPPGGGNPLPVELTNFSAKMRNYQVDLNWTTETEINNDYFTIERSADNINFSTLEQVSGSGNSSTRHNYSFVDDRPLRGVSYYRLKQTDYDGTTVNLPTVVVDNVRRKEFTAYPNPAPASNVQLSYESDQLKYYHVTVQDVQGKTIPANVEIQENGNMKLSIDKSHIQEGALYLIRASDGKENLQQKIILY